MEESQHVAIPNALNPASQKKHAAIIERLSNPNTSKSHSNSSQSSNSIQSFLHRFSQSKLSIQASIDQCRRSFPEDPSDSKPKLKSDLDNISSSVADLEKLLAENSYFLPSYELRSCLKSISELKESLESTISELLPRKKFSFRNKPTRKTPVAAGDEAEASKVADANPEEKKPSFVTRQAAGFQNTTGALLVKRFQDSAGSDFALSDLESCEVRLLGRLRALFIHRLRNCRIFVGPVLGSIHIDEAEGCLLMLASHQIRIHHAKATDFYLRVRSRPIIEDSSGVRFAPYGLVYEGIEGELKDSGLGEETGNWANVDDFRWLRAVQSPNWCLLPEEERIGTVDISDSLRPDGDDGHSPT
ncbi:hypothetical protein ACLOJK_016267 [Asimina triloba]